MHGRESRREVHWSTEMAQTRDSKYDRLEYKRSSRRGHVRSANLWGQINIDHGNYFEITHVLP